MSKRDYNRIRYISFRVTEKEYEQIREGMEEENMATVSDYCRRCIRDPDLRREKKKYSQLREIGYRLRRIENALDRLIKNLELPDDLSRGTDLEKKLNDIGAALSAVNSMLQRLEK